MANIKGRCEPAYSIIVALGGVTRTAKICDITCGAVSRWLSSDGGKGVIPLAHWTKIIEYARKHNIALSVYDLSGMGF